MGRIKINISKCCLWGEYLLIFVCVGSREYQFDRLIRQVDMLIDNGIITEEVYGQIGESNYIPRNYKFQKFMNSDEFKEYQEKADIIISHAGTGSLVSSLKLKKQVISVPRLEKYEEHTDDHQLQVSKALSQEGYLFEVLDITKLGETINMARVNPIKKKYDKESKIIPLITNFIDIHTKK